MDRASADAPGPLTSNFGTDRDSFQEVHNRQRGGLIAQHTDCFRGELLREQKQDGQF